MSNQPLIEYEKPDVLTRQQINQALMDIEDMHPLRSRAKFEHILPSLKIFRTCIKKKPDFKHALRKTLLEEMSIKMPKSDTQILNDPFLMIGYGINAYFDIIMSLCLGCLTISLFCIPLFMGYSRNSEKGLATESKYFINQYSLGNMGGSNIMCSQKRIGTATMRLTCPNGLMQTEQATFGLMNMDVDQKIYCTEQAIWSSGFDNTAVNCTANADMTLLKKRLTDKCDGQTSCDIDITGLLNAGVSSDVSAKCGDEAFVYVQAPCLIDSAKAIERRLFGLVVGCVAVFIYLFTVVYYDYIKSVQATSFVDWDVKTITAGDYTIEFDLDEETYENWQKKYYDPSNPVSENAQFKLYVQNELEARITAMPDMGFDPDNKDEPIKIAQITFAYNNAKIINWLQTRGTYVKTEKWPKVDEINATILKEIKGEGKDKNLLNKLQTPCSVFATFESEEGYNRAKKYNELPQLKFCGQELDLQEASEPTDIIWENRHFKPITRSFKRLIVYIVIVLMLAGSAAIIYRFTMISLGAKLKYPKVQCSLFDKEYTGRSSAYENDAVAEFNVNNGYSKAGKPTHFTGVMQCFCAAQKLADAETDQLYYKTTDTEKANGEPICQQYSSDKLKSTVYGQSIAFIIIAINIVLKTVIIKGITWVGEDTCSEQLASITNGVFVAQFFNTGILLLLVNGNLTEHPPKFITKSIQGPFYDYMPDWYSNVGYKIVQTMIINSIMPYVGLCTGFAIPWLKRKLDRKFKDDIYITKKTSMAQYKDLYSGADYVIHFKYSGILNIMYITMMYGVGMPILFPIAAFNFLNQYICEKLIVAYQVRQPPALDNKLTINCIDMLKWSPILFLFNGYWMLSNEQIFKNTWFYIQNTNEKMKSGHKIYLGVNWAAPVLLMCAASIFLIIVQKVFADYLMKWGFALSDQEIEVDEDLPNFFKSVKLSQADEIIAEESNMKANFGFSFNDGDTIETLDATCVPKKAIQGTPWYQILSNPKYSNLFYYIGAFVGERHKLIEDGAPDRLKPDGEMEEDQIAIRQEQSDMIMVLLNLAYIPDDVIKQIPDFRPGWQVKFKQLMDDWKANFEQEHGRKWEFQNGNLEAEYKEFCAKRALEDKELAEDQERVKQELAKRKEDALEY